MSFGFGSLHAQVREGKIAFAKKDYKSALNYFQNAKTANPSDGEPYYYSALVHERTNHKSSAITEYRRATELNLNSDLKRKAFWKLVLHYRHIQDWDNLLAVSQKFLEFQPNSEVEKLKDLAETNINPIKIKSQKLAKEAETLEKKGQFKAAATLYAEASQLDPDNLQLTWKAADLYLKTDQTTDALTWYRKAIRLSPDSWYSYFQAAVCEYKLLHFTEAIDFFNKAEKLNTKPQSSFLFFLNNGRGLAYLEIERISDANIALKELQNQKTLYNKSSSAAILSVMLTLLSNNRISIEPQLTKISKEDADRPAIPILRSIEAVRSADYIKADNYIDDLFRDNEKRGNRFNRYIGQVLLLISHYYILTDNIEKAETSLSRFKSLDVHSIDGAIFKLVLANPATPFKEDQTQLAKRYSKDLALFAESPINVASILEGRLLYQNNQFDQALPLLQKQFNDPVSLFYLAQIQLENDNKVEAQLNIKKAVSKDAELMTQLKENQDLYRLWVMPDIEIDQHNN
ncbi:MAG: tetratricopeptide repeat protein [Leptonema sp. (in: Bacteria)]|nr:tetratricopeptide repeat protein [Leptonema sp. (in: bacteria)]